MVKKLTIQCKGVADISSMSGGLSIELESVSMDFIEDISIDNILLYCDNNKLLETMDYEIIANFLMYCDNDKLLENMDYETIANFLEKHYDIEIKEKK